MSSTSHYKAPPRKTEDLTYDNWKKEIGIWEFQSNLEKSKKGGALFLSLEGKARQTVLAEVEVDAINCDDGVTNILGALDRFYKKDESKSAFSAFDDFIKYRRDPGMSLKDYLIEFNLKCHKIENFDMKLPTGVLAYLLLSCANISQEKMEICRATCPELTYEKMKETIEKVGVGTSSSSFNDSKIKFSSQENSGPPSSNKTLDLSTLQIKQEPVFHADMNSNQYEDFDNSDEEVYYGNNNRKFAFNNKRSSSRFRSGGNNLFNKFNSSKKLGSSSFNPIDEFGNTLMCKYCHSLCHLVADCRDCPEHLKRRYQPKGSFTATCNNPEYL